jgi:hypothetical protein
VVLVDAFESGTAGQWRTFTSLLSETAADLPADPQGGPGSPIGPESRSGH